MLYLDTQGNEKLDALLETLTNYPDSMDVKLQVYDEILGGGTVAT